MTTGVTKPPPPMSCLQSTSQRNKKGKDFQNKNKTEAFLPDSELVKTESRPMGRKARTRLCRTVHTRDPHQMSVLSPRSQQTRSCKEELVRVPALGEAHQTVCQGPRTLPVCTGLKEAGWRPAGLGGGWGCGSGVCACRAPSHLGWGSRGKESSSASDPEKAPTL